jgi:hypothetical protein
MKPLIHLLRALVLIIAVGLVAMPAVAGDLVLKRVML